MDVVVLLLALVVILIGAELFTNGIEWFGRKLDLAEGAVGSVLAIGAAFLPPGFELGKGGVAIGLLVLYGWYVRAHLAVEARVHDEDLAPLRLRHLDRGRGHHPVCLLYTS